MLAMAATTPSAMAIHSPLFEVRTPPSLICDLDADDSDTYLFSLAYVVPVLITNVVSPFTADGATQIRQYRSARVKYIASSNGWGWLSLGRLAVCQDADISFRYH